jgi:TRAP-type mannitol/chloroaromatic compound transport system permease small subunit
MPSRKCEVLTEMKNVARFIDRIVVWQAEFSAHLMTLLVLVMVMEVCLRYAFKSPTVWALEFTTFLYGMHFVLGYSYTEHYHGHVHVDLVTSHLPPRVRAGLYLITSLAISLPVCILLCIWSWDNAWQSTRTFERSPSAWNPYIWPVKLFMALGFTLLSLQVLANIIKKFFDLSEKKID